MAKRKVAKKVCSGWKKHIYKITPHLSIPVYAQTCANAKAEIHYSSGAQAYRYVVGNKSGFKKSLKAAKTAATTLLRKGR